MTVDHDRPLSALRLGTVLGSGGQGEVRQLLNDSNLVFKRYFDPDAVNAEALAELVRFPRRLAATEADDLRRQTAWPLARVMDGGRAVGFLMRRVPPDFVGMTAAGPQPRELQYLLYPRKAMWGDIRGLDTDGRVEVVQAFARVVRILHSRSMVIGDISMRNLLWRPGSAASVFMLDCDGSVEEGRAPVLPVPQTPDWDDPELGRRPLNRNSDRYKLALVAGRVLSGSPSVRPGQELRLPADLGETISDAVRRRFDEAAGPHDGRPDANDWIKAVRERRMIAVARPQVPPPTRPALPRAEVDGYRERGSLPVQRPGPSP